MFYFPLVNLLFLILIYRVHKPIFWIIGIMEVSIYMGGVYYIDYLHNFNHYDIILYYLALAGLGLVLGVFGFFVAISLNHRQLYANEQPIK